jgi:hypothetical protein
MSVDGMKKMIWITLGIFAAFIVLWFYASELQDIRNLNNATTTTSPISMSIVEETDVNIWDILESKQAAQTSLTALIVTDESGNPVTDIDGNPVTEPIDSNSAPENPVTDIYGNPTDMANTGENNLTLTNDNSLSETVSVEE